MVGVSPSGSSTRDHVSMLTGGQTARPPLGMGRNHSPGLRISDRLQLSVLDRRRMQACKPSSDLRSPACRELISTTGKGDMCSAL